MSGHAVFDARYSAPILSPRAQRIVSAHPQPKAESQSNYPSSSQGNTNNSKDQIHSSTNTNNNNNNSTNCRRTINTRTSGAEGSSYNCNIIPPSSSCVELTMRPQQQQHGHQEGKVTTLQRTRVPMQTAAGRRESDSNTSYTASNLATPSYSTGHTPSSLSNLSHQQQQQQSKPLNGHEELRHVQGTTSLTRKPASITPAPVLGSGTTKGEHNASSGRIPSFTSTHSSSSFLMEVPSASAAAGTTHATPSATKRSQGMDEFTTPAPMSRQPARSSLSNSGSHSHGNSATDIHTMEEKPTGTTLDAMPSSSSPSSSHTKPRASLLRKLQPSRPAATSSTPSTSARVPATNSAAIAATSGSASSGTGGGGGVRKNPSEGIDAAKQKNQQRSVPSTSASNYGKNPTHGYENSPESIASNYLLSPIQHSSVSSTPLQVHSHPQSSSLSSASGAPRNVTGGNYAERPNLLHRPDGLGSAGLAGNRSTQIKEMTGGGNINNHSGRNDHEGSMMNDFHDIHKNITITPKGTVSTSSNSNNTSGGPSRAAPSTKATPLVKTLNTTEGTLLPTAALNSKSRRNAAQEGESSKLKEGGARNVTVSGSSTGVQESRVPISGGGGGMDISSGKQTTVPATSSGGASGGYNAAMLRMQEQEKELRRQLGLEDIDDSGLFSQQQTSTFSGVDLKHEFSLLEEQQQQQHAMEHISTSALNTARSYWTNRSVSQATHNETDARRGGSTSILSPVISPRQVALSTGKRVPYPSGGTPPEQPLQQYHQPLSSSTTPKLGAIKEKGEAPQGKRSAAGTISSDRMVVGGKSKSSSTLKAKPVVTASGANGGGGENAIEPPGEFRSVSQTSQSAMSSNMHQQMRWEEGSVATSVNTSHSHSYSHSQQQHQQQQLLGAGMGDDLSHRDSVSSRNAPVHHGPVVTEEWARTILKDGDEEYLYRTQLAQRGGNASGARMISKAELRVRRRQVNAMSHNKVSAQENSSVSARGLNTGKHSLNRIGGNGGGATGVESFGVTSSRIHSSRAGASVGGTSMKLASTPYSLLKRQQRQTRQHEQMMSNSEARTLESEQRPFMTEEQQFRQLVALPSNATTFSKTASQRQASCSQPALDPEDGTNAVGIPSSQTGMKEVGATRITARGGKGLGGDSESPNNGGVHQYNNNNNNYYYYDERSSTSPVSTTVVQRIPEYEVDDQNARTKSKSTDNPYTNGPMRRINSGGTFSREPSLSTVRQASVLPPPLGIRLDNVVADRARRLEEANFDKMRERRQLTFFRPVRVKRLEEFTLNRADADALQNQTQQQQQPHSHRVHGGAAGLNEVQRSRDGSMVRPPSMSLLGLSGMRTTAGAGTSAHAETGAGNRTSSSVPATAGIAGGVGPSTASNTGGYSRTSDAVFTVYIPTKSAATTPSYAASAASPTAGTLGTEDTFSASHNVNASVTSLFQAAAAHGARPRLRTSTTSTRATTMDHSSPISHVRQAGTGTGSGANARTSSVSSSISGQSHGRYSLGAQNRHRLSVGSAGAGNVGDWSQMTASPLNDTEIYDDDVVQDAGTWQTRRSQTSPIQNQQQQHHHHDSQHSQEIAIYPIYGLSGATGAMEAGGSALGGRHSPDAGAKTPTHASSAAAAAPGSGAAGSAALSSTPLADHDVTATVMYKRTPAGSTLILPSSLYHQATWHHQQQQLLRRQSLQGSEEALDALNDSRRSPVGLRSFQQQQQFPEHPVDASSSTEKKRPQRSTAMVPSAPLAFSSLDVTPIADRQRSTHSASSSPSPHHTMNNNNNNSRVAGKLRYDMDRSESATVKQSPSREPSGRMITEMERGDSNIDAAHNSAKTEAKTMELYLASDPLFLLVGEENYERLVLVDAEHTVRMGTLAADYSALMEAKTMEEFKHRMDHRTGRGGNSEYSGSGDDDDDDGVDAREDLDEDVVVESPVAGAAVRRSRVRSSSMQSAGGGELASTPPFKTFGTIRSITELDRLMKMTSGSRSASPSQEHASSSSSSSSSSVESDEDGGAADLVRAASHYTTKSGSSKGNTSNNNNNNNQDKSTSMSRVKSSSIPTPLSDVHVSHHHKGKESSGAGMRGRSEGSVHSRTTPEGNKKRKGKSYQQENDEDDEDEEGEYDKNSPVSSTWRRVNNRYSNIGISPQASQVGHPMSAAAAASVAAAVAASASVSSARHRSISPSSAHTTTRSHSSSISSEAAASTLQTPPPYAMPRLGSGGVDVPFTVLGAGGGNDVGKQNSTQYRHADDGLSPLAGSGTGSSSQPQPQASTVIPTPTKLRDSPISLEAAGMRTPNSKTEGEWSGRYGVPSPNPRTDSMSPPSSQEKAASADAARHSPNNADNSRDPSLSSSTKSQVNTMMMQQTSRSNTPNRTPARSSAYLVQANISMPSASAPMMPLSQQQQQQQHFQPLNISPPHSHAPRVSPPRVLSRSPSLHDRYPTSTGMTPPPPVDISSTPNTSSFAEIRSRSISPAPASVVTPFSTMISVAGATSKPTAAESSGAGAAKETGGKAQPTTKDTAGAAIPHQKKDESVYVDPQVGTVPSSGSKQAASKGTSPPSAGAALSGSINNNNNTTATAASSTNSSVNKQRDAKQTAKAGSKSGSGAVNSISSSQPQATTTTTRAESTKGNSVPSSASRVKRPSTSTDSQKRGAGANTAAAAAATTATDSNAASMNSTGRGTNATSLPTPPVETVRVELSVSESLLCFAGVTPSMAADAVLSDSLDLSATASKGKTAGSSGQSRRVANENSYDEVTTSLTPPTQMLTPRLQNSSASSPASPPLSSRTAGAVKSGPSRGKPVEKLTADAVAKVQLSAGGAAPFTRSNSSTKTLSDRSPTNAVDISLHDTLGSTTFDELNISGDNITSHSTLNPSTAKRSSHSVTPWSGEHELELRTYVLHMLRTTRGHGLTSLKKRKRAQQRTAVPDQQQQQQLRKLDSTNSTLSDTVPSNVVNVPRSSTSSSSSSSSAKLILLVDRMRSSTGGGGGGGVENSKDMSRSGLKGGASAQDEASNLKLQTTSSSSACSSSGTPGGMRRGVARFEHTSSATTPSSKLTSGKNNNNNNKKHSRTETGMAAKEKQEEEEEGLVAEEEEDEDEDEDDAMEDGSNYQQNVNFVLDSFGALWNSEFQARVVPDGPMTAMSMLMTPNAVHPSSSSMAMIGAPGVNSKSNAAALKSRKLTNDKTGNAADLTLEVQGILTLFCDSGKDGAEEDGENDDDDADDNEA